MTIADQSIGEFFGAVASGAVTPSGGAVAAVTGGAGAALCEMACLHTVKTEGYEDVEAEFTELGEQFRRRRQELLTLADEDVTAVETVRKAFDTSDLDTSNQKRQHAMEEATRVPLDVAEGCLEVLDGVPVVIASGNENALADAVTGAFLAHGALLASTATARNNLASFNDEQFVSQSLSRINGIEDAADTQFEEIRTAVEERAPAVRKSFETA